ncbi:hypothetical protein [Rhodococcus sp. IEGM 1318]|uniref:hypothetical protein n=1 Tax=Rhodococcus sp. IEGM 1318 TaxID=3082226 RepID=UPI00295489D9|nr:hypothetical protein [Rhodococcus sp. IEGM 1318]MDV8009187.1 hypothetical protein [Rhodococcus sp. IEGM 1318]
MNYRRRSRIPTLLGVLLLLWLTAGVIAAAQRDYFAGTSADCADVGTILVTIITGPLNYMGVNPTLDCSLPQPSS